MLREANIMKFVVLVHEAHVALDWVDDGCALLRECGEVELICLPTDVLSSLDGSQEYIPPAEKTSTTAELVNLNDFYSQLETADAVVIGPWYRPPMLSEHWQAAKKLKVFSGTFDHRFGDWFDEMQARGITLIDTSRSMTPTVAEFGLAMTLNLLRDIPESMYLAREGKWTDSDTWHESGKQGTFTWDKRGFVHGDLTGRRVGLAGYGSINRRYAELLSPFRCDVHVYDPFVSNDQLAAAGLTRSDSLVELAAASEIFVVALPPTPTTLEIINRDVISALPKGALFLLLTRMAVVEQEPLWERLKAKEIAAAIDVFAPEPPPEDAWFRRHPNVQVTTHIAGGTNYSDRRCFTEACRDAIAVVTGNEPKWTPTNFDDQSYKGKPHNKQKTN